VPYRREAETLLSLWRQVERDLETVEPGTREAEALQAEAAQLRHKYQLLIDGARDASLPEPPPFPAFD
jgi:hypothetical protein